jgi:cell wall-associated NlpC family hydrolase
MRISAGSVVGSLLLMLLALTVAGCARSGRGGLNGKRAEVVSAALSQVGTPYHFGGSQPGKALDCSGLTLYAHHVAGIPIPRHSADQLRAAHPVKAKSLRPGDLVFFGSKGGVDHVGLMVDAERFVHASMSKRRVILSRLDTPYWRAHFAGAGTYLR